MFLRNAHQTVIEEYDRLNATRGANRARKMVRDLIQESGLDTLTPGERAADAAHEVRGDAATGRPWVRMRPASL